MTGVPDLRSTFNDVAEDYDAIRPGYPAKLFEDIIEVAALPADARLLEIGCGTGQATLPFAQRGYAIQCLDIGADMIRVARKKLAQYPNVQFQQASFEEWPLQPAAFDLAFSATAFHWIPAEVGYPKAAAALEPGGSLAVFWNEQRRETSGFFVEVQEIYRKFLPASKRSSPLPKSEEEHNQLKAFITSLGLFESVQIRTYPFERVFTTPEYLRLLNTFSDHRALPEADRARLFEAIAELIERRFEGKVNRLYLSVLFLAKKVDREK